MPLLVELEPSYLTSAEAEAETCGKSGCYTYSSYSATYANTTYTSPTVQYMPIYEYVPVPVNTQPYQPYTNNNLWLILMIILALIIISLLVVVITK